MINPVQGIRVSSSDLDLEGLWTVASGPVRR